MSNSKQAAEAAKVTAAVDPAEELVTICLFKDDDRYSDDVFVAVNGRRFQIRRGEEVQVPRYVKEVLDHSQKQDLHTARMMEKLAQDYAAKG